MGYKTNVSNFYFLNTGQNKRVLYFKISVFSLKSALYFTGFSFKILDSNVMGYCNNSVGEQGHPI